ncbi:MAG: hypothetical protein FWD96_02475 [Defluviitaleaceae bacterium]|nr:hypothetical protein [Defluviitaleaceae bacterium]
MPASIVTGVGVIVIPAGAPAANTRSVGEAMLLVITVKVVESPAVTVWPGGAMLADVVPDVPTRRLNGIVNEPTANVREKGPDPAFAAISMANSVMELPAGTVTVVGIVIPLGIEPTNSRSVGVAMLLVATLKVAVVIPPPGIVNWRILTISAA